MLSKHYVVRTLTKNDLILFIILHRRKINFKQFKEALHLLADKKFPGDADAFKKLEEIILQAKGPATTGATVSRCIGNVHVK